MNEQNNIYTMEQWGKDKTLSVKPGQFVENAIFAHLLECVPPLHYSYDYMQVGEAHGYDFQKQKTTYATFVKENGMWKFVGNLPSGECSPGIKTFDDLVFNPHPISEVEENPTNFQARLDFPNGYGVSVVLGSMFYSNGKDTYEVGIMKFGKLRFIPEFGSEVLGHRTKEEVTEIMQQLQGLGLLNHKPKSL